MRRNSDLMKVQINVIKQIVKYMIENVVEYLSKYVIEYLE